MSIEFIQQYLGPLTIPMLALSFLVLIILFERLLVLILASFNRPSTLINSFGSDEQEGKQISSRIRSLPSITAQGIELIDQYSDQEKSIREEVTGIWLLQQKRKLSSGLRVLQIIAVLAPLLGLFGTVLGLIKVFDDLAVITGAIEPSMLAEGLGLAMYTTASGLLIAVPALAGAHGYAIWADKLIHHAEHVMNHFNLMVEGVPIKSASMALSKLNTRVSEKARISEQKCPKHETPSKLEVREAI